MGIIKGVLKEELENAVRLKKEYQKTLQSHPAGSLIKKKIRGRYYFYHAFRQGDKVVFIYKGKEPSKEFLVELQKSRALRQKYRKLIQVLTKRIKYLKKVLHGKEDV